MKPDFVGGEPRIALININKNSNPTLKGEVWLNTNNNPTLQGGVWLIKRLGFSPPYDLEFTDRIYDMLIIFDQ